MVDEGEGCFVGREWAPGVRELPWDGESIVVGVEVGLVVLDSEWLKGDDHIIEDLLAGDTKLGKALELQGLMPGGSIFSLKIEDDGGGRGWKWLGKHD